MGGEQNAAGSSYPMSNFTPKGHEIRPIYTDRLRIFTSEGQYEHFNLNAKLDFARTNATENVNIKVWSAPGMERPRFHEAVKNEFKETEIGQSFGPSWTTHWFKFEIEAPKSWNYKVVHFEFDCDCEGLLYTADGEPMQGLTGGNGGDKRHEYILPSSWHSGKHTLYVEAGMNGMFGNASGDIIQPPDEDRWFTLREASLVAPNIEARALYLDFWVIGDCARELPQDSWESHMALQVGNEIMNSFDGSQESILRCRKIAQKFIGRKVDSEKVYKSDHEPLVFAMSNCHIDTAWLWPFAETRRKAARSWSSQLELMERYPEHRFAVSQAQQFHWLKQDYPSLFSRVRDAMKQGRFEHVGGSWVEMDANMPSGESIARQFLYGQRFFERHFGSRSEIFWLPDTFGYCVQLPQLCRLAGFNYGFTQKLSWNNINTFPHTTFNWVSPDGTQLLMHMAPAETYTAQAHVGDVLRSMSQHKSLSTSRESLLPFGNGDGGGGATSAMLEKLRRCRGISDTVGCLPRVTMGKSVLEFYRLLEKKSADGQDLCTWHGELYLELHRGCYTSQAHTKRNNRKSEALLHDVEFLATIASLYADYKYPKTEIDRMWEVVLLCQFHDVLPGSSIGMVYEDTAILYEEVKELAEGCIKKAIAALKLDQGEQTLLNCLPWETSAVFAGRFFEGGHIAAHSTVMDPVKLVKEKNGVITLSNKQLIVTISDGVITSLWDRENDRQVIADCKKAGQFVIYDDKPLYWQAWDTEIYSLDTRKEISPCKVRVKEQNDAKRSIEVQYRIGKKSTLNVNICLAAHSRKVEFDCDADWHEDLKFLKVEFPVDVTAQRASYDTQFGVVERATHFNTSWDSAKFEVCSHKWADLYEHNYGVAILNDCKYGFATHGNVMRLSLLRSPKAPDANADMGRHKFRFCIFPHKGPLNVDVVRAARQFNSTARPIKGTNEYLDAIRLDTEDAVILETIKRGEDDEDVAVDEVGRRRGKSVILRLFESLGGKGVATIRTKFGIKSAWMTNILEDELERLPVTDGNRQVIVDLRPFEILTVKLEVDLSSRM